MKKHCEPLAVIGAYCCVPGAFSPEEFWDNLSQGKVSISTIPNSRYPFDIYKSETNGVWGRSYSNIAGVVDFEEFNNRYKPLFIQELIDGGISPESISTETLLLFAAFTAYNAIKSAGYNPFKLPDAPFSVFSGMVRQNDRFATDHLRQYASWLKETFSQTCPEFSEQESTAVWNDFDTYLDDMEESMAPVYSGKEKCIPHYVARYIQQLFKFKGQGLVFDNACSTSLAAVYLAKQFLSIHPEGIALCGGFSLISKTNVNLFSFNEASSNQGSRPFDEQANGLIQGEGCSFLLVRPLSSALNAGNQILGIVRGIGVSCDGKGKGLWAPSSKGQHLAITKAWEGADAGTNSPDYIEAHATSTRLGDATELEALNKFLKEKQFDKPIPITSVKANIGHLIEAAGATSAIKVLQSLRHQTILPQASFKSPSSKFDWDNSLLYVPREIKSWPVVKDKKRLAIVEAFGIGGLNASAVFEGPETARQTNQETYRAPAAPQAVAIVGVGCVAPGAFDAKSFRSRVKQGESVMSFLPEDRSDLFLTKADIDELTRRGVKAGFIKDYSYDWKRHSIPPKHLSLGHQMQYWFLDAIDQAVDDAGMPQNIKQSNAQPERWDRSKTAIIAGSIMSTDYSNSMIVGSLLCDIENSIRLSFNKMGIDKTKAEDVARRYHDAIMKRFRFDEDPTGGYSISTLGSRVAKSYDITGPLFAIDNGLSTSVTALTLAYNVLQDPNVDNVFCICGNRSQEDALHKLLRSKDASVAPPAEGAVALILKRVEDALANGDKIYAIIPRIEMESANACIQEKGNSLTTTTLKSCSSSETSDIDKPVTKVFGDFGSLNGMMSLVNVLLDFQEKNQVAPSKWQIQHKDCEGIAFTMDIENAAAYRNRSEKRETIIENSDKKEMNTDNRLPVVDHSNVSSRSASGSSLRKPGSRVAFLFEGQGAQYPNMMSGLTELPGAKEIIEEIDSSLTSVGLPDFKTVLQTEGALLGKDTFRTQLSLLIADTFIYRLYASHGIRPDVMMGHSYGEYPAMTAVGVWSFKDAALATQKRCLAIENALSEFNVQRTKTAMMSTNASEDQIEEAMAAIPDAATTIYVSNRNAPTQTIISGTYASIKKMEKFLLSCQRLALILPVPAAFHSPLMDGVRKPFAEALKPFEFDLPTGLLLSSVTSAFESDPDVYRSNLVEQMTKPVDFIAMIRKAYNVGCRHFVDIGPKRILTNLAKQILSDCSDVTFYISDNSKGGDPEKFLEVCSKLSEIQPENVDVTVTQTLSEKRETAEEKQELRSEKLEAQLPQSIPHSTLPASSYTISVCHQSGTPYEMGLQYGKQYSKELRAMVRRYVDIVGQSSEKLLPPVPAMDAESLLIRFGKDGLEEMRGVADGAGIPLETIVRHNVCLFPTLDTTEQKKLYNTGKSVSPSVSKMNLNSVENIASGCVQFAGTTPNGAFVHGCNIDLPFKRLVPDSVQVQVQVRHPANQISHCFVGVTGMMGAIGGINSKGLCVTSCTLLDYPTPFQVKPEAMEHPTLIEKILSECSNIDQALKVIYKNGAIGGWTIGLTEGGTGAIAQVEYCDKMVIHRDAMDFLVQANHSQLLVHSRPERGIEVPDHSRIREARLRQILTNDGMENTMAVDALTAFAALRDVKLPNQTEKPLPGAFRTINMLHRIDNVCSWMFNHTAQTLLVASTPDIYVSEDDKALWNEIPIKDLLPDYDARLTRKEGVADNIQTKTAAPAAPAAPQTTSEQKKAFSAAEITKFTPSQFYGKISQEMPELEKTITGRYIECLVEAPALPDDLPAISGRTLVIGSEKNPVVTELVRYLKSASNDYVVYELTANNAGKSEDVVVSEIDALWQQRPISNIFVVPSWDDASSRKFNQSDWNRTEQTIILPLYMALRQIYRCANAEKAVGNLRLAAGVCLGGDFGFAGYSDRVEGGAVAGIIRVLHEENVATFRAANNYKTVDFPLNTNPRTVANTLVKELLHYDWQPDVCYQSDKRYFLTMFPEVVSSSAIEAAPKPKSGEVWLVTGGARGVTAELAYYLAKKRNAKLYLLASSPLPKIDPAWRTLDADGLKELKQSVVRAALAEKKKPAAEWSKVEKALEIDKNFRRLDEAKIPWTYMTCDLSSYENAAQAVNQILRQEGHINGVLHGAGVEKSTTFYKKDSRFVRMTIDVKVGSLWAILETLEQSVPEYVVMMGSAAGRLGGNGQTDYGLSNYMSSKMLNRYTAVHPHCRAYTVHWNAWDEVGMSVRPESLFAFKSMGMAMMPVKEGCDHFYNELIIDNYQPELSPLPFKLYQDTKLKELEASGVKAGAPEEKKELAGDSQESQEPRTTASDSFFPEPDQIYGSNADAYELRKLIGNNASGDSKGSPIDPSFSVLMICRDEQLSRLMNKAQIEYRIKTVHKNALEWVKACKRNGVARIFIPTCTSFDPITQEFIESVKAIVPVEEIPVPWTMEPAQCAQTILKKIQGGDAPTPTPEPSDKKQETVSPKTASTPHLKLVTPESTPSLPALLNNICHLADDAIEAECTVDPTSDVFLLQHQLKGRPILPIVMGLELVAETAKVLSVKQGLDPMSTITNVRIVRGMTCTQDVPYRLVCRLEKTQTPNVWNALVKGDYYNKAGKKINENCPYYRCTVIFGQNGAKHDVVASRSSLDKMIELNYPKFGERSIYHGPALQCLKTVRYNDGTFAVGDIIQQNISALFGSRSGDIATNPAMMDACLYTCGILNIITDKHLIFVPDQFESIEYGSGKVTPGESCECCCQLVRSIELPGGYEQKIFNYTLYNKRGEVVVNVVNCQATVVRE